MDTLSMSSGHICETINDRERGKLTQETKGENELTLMRLRRLSRTVMSKNERHRFEARKLYRSNVVTYLESHLMHSSEKVRYLALELFCCTIPRLANKTDCLLRPILPKVFQCLRGNEGKDMKLKALHFLRGFFRHTKSLSSFIDHFVRLGIENADPEIRISCCLGLSIVFDQDIGNNLYSHLVTSVGNLLTQRSQHHLIRAAYRALKHIHKTIGDDRFFYLMRLAHPEATEMYKSLYTFEESDSFLSTNDSNCSSLLFEYQMKRKNLNLIKDFGILDPILLDRIYRKRNCERARVLGSFLTALKRTPWTEDDLDPHILDFLKIIQSFINDSNRLIQMSGYDILKEVINKMGFTLSPHIRYIVEIIRYALISANSKIRSKVDKVLHKLMRSTHPMTVIWELLSTKNDSLKEAVLMLIQEKVSCFPYYELDMVALCNILGHTLEDKNSRLAKNSRDCIILLLDIMRDCPVYGIRTEAVRVLLRNYKFSRETLKDIGVLGNSEDDDSREGFHSYSEDEMTDLGSASVPMGSTATGISLTDTQRTISTAGESEARCIEAYSDVSLRKSSKTLCEDTSSVCLSKTKVGAERHLSSQEKSVIELDLHSHLSSQTPVNWEENFEVAHSANKTSKDSFIECSDSSSIKEQLLSSEADSASSKYFRGTFVKDTKSYVEELQGTDCATPVCSKNEETVEFNQDLTSSFKTRKSPEIEVSLDEEHLIQRADGSDIGDEPQNLQSAKKTRKYFTRFCIKTDVDYPTIPNNRQVQDTQAGGDVDVFAGNSSLDLQTKSDVMLDSRFVAESYEQDGVQVDVMNKNLFNFNIMQVEHQSRGGLEETEHFESLEDKFRKLNPISNKTRITILQKEKYGTPDRDGEIQESRVRKSRILKSTAIVGNDDAPSELPDRFAKYDSQTKCQKYIDSNFCQHQQRDSATDTSESIARDDRTERSPVTRQLITGECCDTPATHFSECLASYEQNLITNASIISLQEIDSNVEVPVSYYKIDENETPFLPKSRQLPRTPISKRKGCTSEVQPKLKNKVKKSTVASKKKVINEKKRDVSTDSSNNHKEETDKSLRKTCLLLNGTEIKNNVAGKLNTPSKWGGCQWRRDLEYASKAASCPWAEKFEKLVRSMKPFPSSESAENEMKKAVDDLFGNSWKGKEEAMLTVIRLAKHHPEVVQDNTTKIVVALSNEIKNFRQSVAGKAVLTTGHLYEIMGKFFENKLRIVVAALLAKSGNRTLAAYFRLVIKSLVKITSSTSPHKAALAFIHEGSRHANKAARETAAQFLTTLTEHMGPENSLAPSFSSQMLKCAAMFVSDSSALTRYCGKRMFKVFMKNPDFDKLKDHQLDINTAENLSKILEQIKAKGITEEVLPINIID